LYTYAHNYSRLSPLVKYHKLYGVNMKAIYDLIHKLKEFRTDFSTLDDWVSNYYKFYIPGSL
jgi:hypothetical protein